MTKQKLTLSLDSRIIQNAKKTGLCISTFLEVKLVEHFSERKMQRTCRDLNPSQRLRRQSSLLLRDVK
ncbi:MAG: type II toxin-antitoxin system CcdA family antitoxin [Candidatus Thermoplasmatota archaeon]|nr:type II toxin-antitoxin system CcdA family antitoxin [Candidatus Thermoplasmatota archaeon]